MANWDWKKYPEGFSEDTSGRRYPVQQGRPIGGNTTIPTGVAKQSIYYGVDVNAPLSAQQKQEVSVVEQELRESDPEFLNRFNNPDEARAFSIRVADYLARHGGEFSGANVAEKANIIIDEINSRPDWGALESVKPQANNNVDNLRPNPSINIIPQNQGLFQRAENLARGIITNKDNARANLVNKTRIEAYDSLVGAQEAIFGPINYAITSATDFRGELPERVAAMGKLISENEPGTMSGDMSIKSDTSLKKNITGPGEEFLQPSSSGGVPIPPMSILPAPGAQPWTFSISRKLSPEAAAKNRNPEYEAVIPIMQLGAGVAVGRGFMPVYAAQAPLLLGQFALRPFKTADIMKQDFQKNFLFNVGLLSSGGLKTNELKSGKMEIKLGAKVPDKYIAKFPIGYLITEKYGTAPVGLGSKLNMMKESVKTFKPGLFKEIVKQIIFGEEPRQQFIISEAKPVYAIMEGEAKKPIIAVEKIQALKIESETKMDKGIAITNTRSDISEYNLGTGQKRMLQEFQGNQHVTLIRDMGLGTYGKKTIFISFLEPPEVMNVLKMKNTAAKQRPIFGQKGIYSNLSPKLPKLNFVSSKGSILEGMRNSIYIKNFRTSGKNVILRIPKMFNLSPKITQRRVRSKTAVGNKAEIKYDQRLYDGSVPVISTKHAEVSLTGNITASARRSNITSALQQKQSLANELKNINKLSIGEESAQKRRIGFPPLSRSASVSAQAQKQLTNLTTKPKITTTLNPKPNNFRAPRMGGMGFLKKRKTGFSLKVKGKSKQRKYRLTGFPKPDLLSFNITAFKYKQKGIELPARTAKNIFKKTLGMRVPTLQMLKGKRLKI